MKDNKIKEIAYSLWESNGCPQGKDLEFWLDAEKMYEKNEKPAIKNVMLKVNGVTFRCDCGCNVFHHPRSEDDLLHECNSCGVWWRGSKGE